MNKKILMYDMYVGNKNVFETNAESTYIYNVSQKLCNN